MHFCLLFQLKNNGIFFPETHPITILMHRTDWQLIDVLFKSLLDTQ